MLWNGKPGGGIRFAAYDIFLVPFSFVWTGLAFCFEGAAIMQAIFGPRGSFISDNMPPGFILFGIPFCLVGLYITIGRFLIDAWSRGATLYAATDHRLLILKGRSSKSLPLNNLPALTLNEKRNGRGTIFFGDMSFFENAAMWTFGPAYTPVMMFFDIPNVRDVHNLILTAAKAAGTRR